MKIRSRPFICLLAFVVTIGTLMLFAPNAAATFHTFRIERLYSNADGSVQFIVLHEASNADGQDLWAGHTFTSTHGATTKLLTFQANLPNANTSGRRVLIASEGFAALHIVAPDYTMPDRFLATDGGTIDFAGVSKFTYAILPTDGVSGIDSNGNIAPNRATNYAGASGSVAAAAVTSVEFYNAALDHYFISALAPDIDALDSGRLVGWVRTSRNFKVHSSASRTPDASPVCRILIPPPADSHFFSASPGECAETLAKFPFMQKETDNAFYIALPVTTPGPTAGNCATGTVPVYRVFNNRADGNHRYTTDRAMRDMMVDKGGIKEGYGDDAVIMCAPA